jgi:hypothetical protein
MADNDAIDHAAESANFLAALEGGNKQALWQAIVYCAAHHIPLWDWLSDGLLLIDNAVEAGIEEIETWDDVFGKLWGRGQRRGAHTWAQRWKVYTRVEEAKDAGKAINGQLFEDIGKDLGIGGRTTVSNLYGSVDRSKRRLEAAGIIPKTKGPKRGPKGKDDPPPKP